MDPNEHSGSLSITDKLVGAKNYTSWRRQVQIGPTTNRKLGFITGTLKRSKTDPNLADKWDICNNMVIAWIMHFVSVQISKSILFVESALDIWLQLEKRFALGNGWHKYNRLNKEIYETKQSEGVIIDYYTTLKCIWEELDSMIELPRISGITSEISAFLKAIEMHKEEQHLFQFLNGLDNTFSAQRSQILLLNPLPTVEAACAMLQLEESQREVLTAAFIPFNETSAMFSRGNNYGRGSNNDTKCKFCGNKGHPPERCWTKIRYPEWHSKAKEFPQKPRFEGKEIKPGFKGKENYDGRVGERKTAAQVDAYDKKSGEGIVMFTQSQFE